jgi:hypothetical protein
LCGLFEVITQRNSQKHDNKTQRKEKNEKWQGEKIPSTFFLTHTLLLFPKGDCGVFELPVLVLVPC